QQTGDLSLSCLDVDGGGALTYAKVSGPSHGTATVNADGTWMYSPTANYSGADSFKFTASNDLTSALTTGSLTIDEVNDAPIATNDSKIVTATTTTTIIVTSNDFSGPKIGSVTSEPGDTISVTSVTPAVRGSVSIAPGAKSVIYDPRGCLVG